MVVFGFYCNYMVIFNLDLDICVLEIPWFLFLCDGCLNYIKLRLSEHSEFYSIYSLDYPLTHCHSTQYSTFSIIITQLATQIPWIYNYNSIPPQFSNHPLSFSQTKSTFFSFSVKLRISFQNQEFFFSKITWFTHIISEKEETSSFPCNSNQ